jgi:DNA-binding beta-propeller fold protein YncE
MSGSLSGTPVYQVDNSTLAGGAAKGAEVSVYDAARGLIFILGPDGVDALDVATGALRFSLPASDAIEGDSIGGTSVAVHGNLLAVSFEGAENGLAGTIAFYDLAADGMGATHIRSIAAGATPDQLTFTPDGGKLLVAIEGQPNTNYTDNDPAGTLGDAPGGVMVIDTADAAGASYLSQSFLGFEGFDADTLRDAGVRIKAGATAAQDLEPEYITVAADGTKAYVTLQENNAVAVLDLVTGTYTGVYGLGSKDFSLTGNGIDPSNEDGGVNIRQVPVRGLYMPDGIANFEFGGKTYLVTANEGDAREYDAYEDTTRVKDVVLDEASFGGAAAVAALQQDEDLGRLTISSVDGDTDGDGDIDVLYALGGRSMSIWSVDEAGISQVWDSGDMIESILATQFPDLLNDGRSDDKGPEPESVKLGTVDGVLYAFLALERSDSVMAFRIDGPDRVSYAGLIETGAAEPEVISFIPDAPGGPLLIAPNEGDGITTAIRVHFPVNGSEVADTLRGTGGSDTIFGLGGNDLIIASGGTDRVDGGAGHDLLRFEALALGDVSLSRNEGGAITGIGWTDAAGTHATAITNVETLSFVDATISFSGDTVVAAVEGLYRGLLGRAGEVAGRSFWVDAVQHGDTDLAGVAAAILASGEGMAATGGASNAAFLDGLYENALFRAADAGGRAFWSAALDRGETRAEVAAEFLGSQEAQQDPGGVASQGLVVVDGEAARIGWAFEALMGRSIGLTELVSLRSEAEHVDGTVLLGRILDSQEFSTGLGAQDDAGFLAGLYDGVLHRAGDAEGLAFFTGELAAGTARGVVVEQFLASAEAKPFELAIATNGVDLL